MASAGAYGLVKGAIEPITGSAIVGAAKERLTAEQQQGWTFVDGEFACAECVEEPGLKEWVSLNANEHACSYCGRSAAETPVAVAVNDLALQNLVLHLQGAVGPAQPHQLRPLVARQALSVALVDIGLPQPAVQARPGDPRVRSDPRDRFLPQPGQFDSTTAELGWVGSRHPGLLPGRHRRLRLGVREGGAGSQPPDLLPHFAYVVQRFGVDGACGFCLGCCQIVL